MKITIEKLTIDASDEAEQLLMKICKGIVGGDCCTVNVSEPCSEPKAATKMSEPVDTPAETAEKAKRTRATKAEMAERAAKAAGTLTTETPETATSASAVARDTLIKQIGVFFIAQPKETRSADVLEDNKNLVLGFLKDNGVTKVSLLSDDQLISLMAVIATAGSDEEAGLL